MAVVEFGKIDYTTKFSELEIGTYFEFEGELFVKLRIAKEEDDAYGDEGEEVNAFSFTTDDTTFFENYDKVTPIPTKAIRISVSGEGD